RISQIVRHKPLKRAAATKLSKEIDYYGFQKAVGTRSLSRDPERARHMRRKMIMKSVAQIGFIVALLHSIVGAPQGFAQTRALKKINWGVTSRSASNCIPWVAKYAKISEKH